jgi:hypothetical protein
VFSAVRAGRTVLGGLGQKLVGGAFLLVALGVLLAPRLPVNRYDAAQVAVGVALVILAWFALALLPRPAVHRYWWDAGAAVTCAALGGLAWIVAYGGGYRPTWDPGTVEHASTLPPGPDLVDYFSVYPNMRPLLAIARTLRDLTAGSGIGYQSAFAVLNAASFLVTAAAVYLLVRRVAGPPRGVLALLGLGALLGTSPWLSVAYTDLPVLWTPVTAVACWVAAWGRRGAPSAVALAALGGAALAVGSAVKVTPVVGLVALVAAVALALTGTPAPAAPSRTRQVVTLLAAVAAFAVAVPAFGAWVRSAEELPPLREEWAATPLTFVASGYRTQVRPDGTRWYGTWDRYVTGATKLRGTAEQNEVAREFIRSEWERRGATGTAAFAVDKTLFNWGDGTFWARGEGNDRTAPALRQGRLPDVVLAWNAPAGRHFGTHVLLAQVLWLAVLLAAGAGLLRAAYRPELLLMALTVAGIAVFTLLFQGRSRYLLGHVPVVIALAACVVPRATWRTRHEPVEGEPEGRDEWREDGSVRGPREVVQA